MDFLGIGGWEILLILVIAMIIWGPNKLPEIARTLGKIVRALRKASFDITTAVTKEIESTEKTPPSPAPDSDKPSTQSAGKQPRPSRGTSSKNE